MCAQFLIKESLKELAYRFEVEIVNDFAFPNHIFPRYQAPVIVEHENKRWLAPMLFGFVPFFEKSEKPKSVFHNARSETVLEKQSFRREIVSNRCLVPLSSFIEAVQEPANQKEGQKNGSPKNDLQKISPQKVGTEKKSKFTWWRFDLLEPEKWLVAGVWSIWKRADNEKPQRTFAILTKSPYAVVSKIGHDRSPLFLPKENWEIYLNKKTSSGDLLELFSLSSQEKFPSPLLEVEKITK